MYEQTNDTGSLAFACDWVCLCQVTQELSGLVAVVTPDCIVVGVVKQIWWLQCLVLSRYLYKGMIEVWTNTWTKRRLQHLDMTKYVYKEMIFDYDNCWLWPDMCANRWLLILTRYMHREMIVGYDQICAQRADNWLCPDVCTKRWLLIMTRYVCKEMIEV